KWVTNDYFADQSQVYADPTPMADKAASDAVLALGNQLYGSGSTTANTAEQDAWGALATELNNGGISADDARLLLEDGGFARSAPDSGTLPFRVAVEDLKARFAACGWANPPDPNGVLSDEVTTAANEWQQEISSQQTQRDAILTDSQKATTALATTAQDLGEILGRSWQAGRLADWNAYWTGPGRVGTGPVTFHLHTASGECLDVLHSSSANGTTLQAWACNNTTAQTWTLDTGTGALVNQATHKCLDVDGTHGTPKAGTRVQIWDCNRSGSQQWQFSLTGGTTRLFNTGTQLCLDMHTDNPGQAAQVWTCNGSGP